MNKVVLWVALGVGVLILYSAYKGKALSSIISDVTSK